MNYAERQRKWMKENNVHVGDKVKVVRKADDYEDGWGDSWVEKMDEMFGGVYEIVENDDVIGEEDGLLLKFNKDLDFHLPYFCLEVVGDKIEQTKDNHLLREEEEEVELINGNIYHITCHRTDDSPSEWIYRYDNSIGGRTRCNGSYEVFADEDKYWEGRGFVADEDEIESIRKATKEEKDIFLEAECRCIEKEARYQQRVDQFYEEHEEDQLCADYSAEAGEVINSIKFGYSKPKNKYSREIFPNVFIDVYDVLRAFKVEDGALQHLIKKALADGQRGHKDQMQDRIDIRDSAECAIRNLKIKIKIEENE